MDIDTKSLQNEHLQCNRLKNNVIRPNLVTVNIKRASQYYIKANAEHIDKLGENCHTSSEKKWFDKI